MRIQQEHIDLVLLERACQSNNNGSLTVRARNITSDIASFRATNSIHFHFLFRSIRSLSPFCLHSYHSGLPLCVSLHRIRWPLTKMTFRLLETRIKIRVFGFHKVNEQKQQHITKIFCFKHFVLSFMPAKITYHIDGQRSFYPMK